MYCLAEVRRIAIGQLDACCVEHVNGILRDIIRGGFSNTTAMVSKKKFVKDASALNDLAALVSNQSDKASSDKFLKAKKKAQDTQQKQEDNKKEKSSASHNSSHSRAVLDKTQELEQRAKLRKTKKRLNKMNKNINISNNNKSINQNEVPKKKKAVSFAF
ncbi:hypothetical protein E3P86_00892 [Wallemia ichthyophaga]|uniref:Uncharacterized protein n=1 Tax=Wallemia ichthyophaga TaxID=245174 RepID=A0A4T0JAH0_WALIC|nr:hypothetical protein E3P86_00892 [Wallemia ichthyophaga]